MLSETSLHNIQVCKSKMVTITSGDHWVLKLEPEIHDGTFRKDEFNDMNYCPRNNDFQCSKSIPSNMVVESINSYLKI